ncbi:hypothetical protein DICPUDRAFT_77849 [Dictyostelium purpureum]|uniref:Uncharacterized protein n=1 Tax=Dictyostelium purpureum TaxID=5786 RepID=F0ZHT3_DICPU|nr:uncharacterized protein DICPUDRAFT_77849 [Dictyostelium purpureum]EGC36532.1 hypothetical protein DICPUDRAFT_77849 [Dictyostelium purpureum]|eukprot:XP_003286977.1 hypothetical protein DICPUDRAFT_77849 [Dictyostelium purpureum]
MSGINALGLGCRYGWFCRESFKLGVDGILGIDLSNKMITKAKELDNDFDNILLVLNTKLDTLNQNKVLNILTTYFKSFNLNYYIINDNQELNQDLQITDKSVIYFLPTLEKLELNNFKEITLQYCNVNKYLLNNNLSTKFIILSTDTKKECINYLNSSVLGAMRYFLEFRQLNLYLTDFDKASLNNININIINSIILKKDDAGDRDHIQREFIFRNNQILIEIIKNNPMLFIKKNNSNQNQNSNKDIGNTILVTGQTGTILNIITRLINSKSNHVENIIILTVSDLKLDLKNLINNHLNDNSSSKK